MNHSASQPPRPATPPRRRPRNLRPTQPRSWRATTLKTLLELTSSGQGCNHELFYGFD